MLINNENYQDCKMTKEKVSHSFLDRLKYAIRFRKWSILAVSIAGPVGGMIGALMTNTDPFDIRAMTVAVIPPKKGWVEK